MENKPWESGRVWIIATVLKTVRCKSLLGSNPSFPAICYTMRKRSDSKIDYITVVTIIGVLLAVIIHEACHVFAALYVGQKPKILGIGFWKPYLSFTKWDMEFRFSPFLLGGFVSFHENLMKSKEVLKELPASKQYCIYLGGCLGNIATGSIALIIFSIIYQPTMIGIALLSFGMMSVVLAVGNLIPFPPLDGWQVVQCGIEQIIGRPFSYKTNLILTYGGLISLSLFTIVSIYYIIVIM